MNVVPAPAQLASRIAAQAQAETLALLIGSVAEAKVTAVEPGGLARLLMGGQSIALPLPSDAALVAGDRVSVRPALAPDGGLRIELKRLEPGETAVPPAPAAQRAPSPYGPAAAADILQRAAPVPSPLRSVPASSGPQAGVAGGDAPPADAGAVTLRPGPVSSPSLDVASLPLASLAPRPVAALPALAPALANMAEPSSAAEAREALLPLAREALAGQRALPGLFVALRAVLERSGAGLAPDLRAAAARVLSAPLDPAKPIAPADLRRAVEASGVFLESDLASGGAATVARGDLKADLLALRPLLRHWLDATPAGAARIASPSQSSPPAVANDAPVAPRPPLRGEVAPLQIHAAAPEALAQPDLAPAIMKELEGALDRIRLMQFASLPERAPAETAQQANAASRQWQVEIPLLMSPGAAALPLTIERDGGGGSAGAGPEIAWRMRFALDTPELGHVDVAVAWRGGRVDVRFWAEEPATAALIAERQADLGVRLETAALPVEAILCQTGRRAAPKATAAPQGRFLDTRS